ncbi:hypothetical protein AB1Y20_011551 [Prymnesium parvum]|uniref:Uncharacterized protein n=1 Tax=Prymnesium parvum TaxID=97485 RepID=A0AB34IGP5_PRYPA
MSANNQNTQFADEVSFGQVTGGASLERREDVQVDEEVKERAIKEAEPGDAVEVGEKMEDAVEGEETMKEKKVEVVVQKEENEDEKRDADGEKAEKEEEEEELVRR